MCAFTYPTPFVLSALKPKAEGCIEGLQRFDTALRLRLSTYSAQTDLLADNIKQNAAADICL